MRTGNCILILMFAAIITLGAIPAAAQSDSAIVGAAKQKTSDKKARHVYTDEDFPEGPEVQAAPREDRVTSTSNSDDAAKTSASTEKSDAKSAEAKADSAKPTENPKLKELQSKLEASKRNEQDLRRKLATLQEKADNEKDDFRRNMYMDIISDQQVTLSEFQREQQNLQSQLEQEQSKNKDVDKDKTPQ